MTAGGAELRECTIAMRTVVCNGLWLSATLVAAPAMRATVFNGVWLGAEGAVRSARRGFSSAPGYLRGGYWGRARARTESPRRLRIVDLMIAYLEMWETELMP